MNRRSGYQRLHDYRRLNVSEVEPPKISKNRKGAYSKHISEVEPPKILLATILIGGVFSPFLAHAGNIDTTNAYAWGENAGWINVSSERCGRAHGG